MKFLLTSLLIICAVNCHAQIIEVGYGPKSTRGWGDLPETAKLNISLLKDLYHSKSLHYTPGVRYSYVNSKSRAIDRFGKKVAGKFNFIFAIPLSFTVDVGKISFLERVGLGLSHTPFPDENGRRLNFLLEAGVQYMLIRHLNFSLSYSHISNGFRGKINPGLDNILLATGFHF